MGALGKGIWSWFHGVQIRVHNKRLLRNHPTVTLFRPNSSGFRPSKVNSEPIELFYRSRPLRIALQLGVGIAVAVWTFKNYIEIIRSL